MEFFNNVVSADFEKIDSLIIDLQIELGRTINQEFVKWIKSGKMISLDEFVNKVDYNTDVIVDKAQETLEKQMEKNKEDFEKQMENHGKEKSFDIAKEDVDIDDILKQFYDTAIQEAYFKLQKMIAGFYL